MRRTMSSTIDLAFAFVPGAAFRDVALLPAFFGFAVLCFAAMAQYRSRSFSIALCDLVYGRGTASAMHFLLGCAAVPQTSFGACEIHEFLDPHLLVRES